MQLHLCRGLAPILAIGAHRLQVQACVAWLLSAEGVPTQTRCCCHEPGTLLPCYAAAMCSEVHSASGHGLDIHAAVCCAARVECSEVQLLAILCT